MQAISILPEYRGKGYAGAFLAKAEEVARKQGADKITLQVEEINQVALKIYMKNGYSESGRRTLKPIPFSDDIGDIFLLEKYL